jgi:hypothetical protein
MAPGCPVATSSSRSCWSWWRGSSALLVWLPGAGAAAAVTRSAARAMARTGTRRRRRVRTLPRWLSCACVAGNVPISALGAEGEAMGRCVMAVPAAHVLSASCSPPQRPRWPCSSPTDFAQRCACWTERSTRTNRICDAWGESRDPKVRHERGRTPLGGHEPVMGQGRRATPSSRGLHAAERCAGRRSRSSPSSVRVAISWTEIG